MFAEQPYEIVVAPIVTMDPERPRAQALATHADRIIAVGGVDEVRAACPVGTPVEELEGATIVPGLIDAHLHLQRAGLKALALGVTGVASFVAEMERTALDEDDWPGGGEPTLEQRVEALCLVQPLVHAMGITGVIDPAVTNQEMRGYQEAHRRGLLTLRVVAMPYPDVSDVEKAIERLSGVGVSTGFGDDHLRLGGIKVYFDGEGMKSEALLDHPWAGTDHGVQRIPDEDFRRLAEFCVSHSWSMGVHAVGGGAVTRVLKALEDAPSELRFQLIHAYLEPSAESIAAAARQGVVAALQPSIHWTNGAGLIGKLGERAVAANPIRSWLDAGATVALGSDGPYFPFDPRWMMWQARTRLVHGLDEPVAPEQAITGAEALAGYTRDAAFASFAEHRRGTLKPGLLADWTALSADPTTCTPEEIRAAAVLRTTVGGTRVLG